MSMSMTAQNVLQQLTAWVRPKTNIESMVRTTLVNFGPALLGIVIFLVLWHVAAQGIVTSLGNLPGPVQVWEQAGNLIAEHDAERARETAFEELQATRKAEFLARSPEERQGEEFTTLTYTGKPTYIDQILTSLFTVFAGFIVGTIIAIPIGIFCGLSKAVQAALNPFIQIFRPVSPLAWLPIVTLVVSALYVSADPMFQKSFVISAITVTLCSLWPTLINTAVGVASIDKDLINVSKVLRLSTRTKVMKIVIPSSLKMIFTGMRLSLGVGWMVLIAAEMLAQNPGLGKFVWDEFQNGSSQSLGRIMVAVFTIGFVGFLLDRVMQSLQHMASFGERSS